MALDLTRQITVDKVLAQTTPIIMQRGETVNVARSCLLQKRYKSSEFYQVTHLNQQGQRRQRRQVTNTLDQGATGGT
jgi:hypothetical protein